MKILITGASGRLAGLLLAKLSDSHEVVGLSKRQMDITDFLKVQAKFREEKPDVVIHTGAWTDVDGCARDSKRARLINGLGTQNVAVASANVGAAIVYVSTNEVFDGKSNDPYFEYDRTNPINAYGYSKWVGEQATLSLNPKHYIVRTSWLFAHGGHNFIHSILNAAEAGKRLRVVINEVANPTYTNDVAEALEKLIATERYGIYHFVNEGWCSRYQFARYLLDQAGYEDVKVDKIIAQEWQRPSVPPEYTKLENTAGALLDITLRSWKEAVDAFLTAEGLLEQQ